MDQFHAIMEGITTKNQEALANLDALKHIENLPIEGVRLAHAPE